MGNVLTTSICNTVVNTLRTIPALGSGVVQKPGEMTEGITDEPTVQVYPEEVKPVTPSGATERTSFGTSNHDKMKRQHDITVHIDLYARMRHELNEDMAALLDLIDPIEEKLEEQSVKPYFGLAGLQAFSWTSSRVIFVYGDPEIKYVGWRWVLTFRVF